MTDKLLQRLYSQPRYGVAFSNVDKIFRKAREFDNNITKQQVENFIRGKTSYAVFAQKRNRFPRRKIFSLTPGRQLSIDLLELSSEQKSANRPYTFLYVQCDIFSNFLNIFPNKKKNVQEILLAMKKSFEFVSPDSILCDKESAFFSYEVRAFLRERKIRLITQQSASTIKYKNSPIENCIRQIKRIIARFTLEYGKPRFILYLKQITEIFNSHVNRRTGYSPNILRWDKDAVSKYQEKLLSELESSANKKNPSPLKLGSLVRVRELDPNVFAKETQKRYSQKIHMIVGVKKSQPPVYKLFPEVESQPRNFYKFELFQLPDDFAEKNKFASPIEKILTKKQLRNKILYECSLIGGGKTVWLTRQDILDRFILFPNEFSREIFPGY